MSNKRTTGIFSEKLLERNLRLKVAKLGGIALKYASAHSTGWSDRFIFMPGGKIYLAEVKTTGQSLTPKQEARVRRARKMGFTVFIIDDKVSLAAAVLVLNSDQL